jgi:hypothetical protein
VDNTSFNGDVSKNPFNFKHFSLSEIMVYLDGQQHGIKPLTSNFASGQYISSFMSLFSGIGKANRGEGNDIDRFDFANGYALYAFDLTPDLSEDDHFNLARQGTVRVDMKFANALPNTITVVAYEGFFSSSFEWVFRVSSGFLEFRVTFSSFEWVSRVSSDFFEFRVDFSSFE